VARKGAYVRQTREPWPDGYLELVKDTWIIPPARSPKRSLGEPPSFPDELVRRVVRLFTDPDDIVHDPMMGRGTAVAVAVGEGRFGLGSDISAVYLEQAAARIAAVPSRLPFGGRCPSCHGPWPPGGRRDRRYCTHACRQRAYRCRSNGGTP